MNSRLERNSEYAGGECWLVITRVISYKHDMGRKRGVTISLNSLFVNIFREKRVGWNREEDIINEISEISIFVNEYGLC